MSSTNRGTLRNKDDYYITPEWVIDNFLKYFLSYVHNFHSNIRILDPCAGGDEEHDMPYPKVLKKFGYRNITTMDIRKNSKAMLAGVDFLTYPLAGPKYDLVISNPPFKLAIDFIEESFKYLGITGYVIMLLRLNFLGSQKRGPFFKRHMPNYVFVSSQRPAFKSGGTDSTEYAHFVWISKESSLHNPQFAQLSVI